MIKVVCPKCGLEDTMWQYSSEKQTCRKCKTLVQPVQAMIANIPLVEPQISTSQLVGVYCSFCGKQIAEGSRFCRYCGTSQTPEGISSLPTSSPTGIAALQPSQQEVIVKEAGIHPLANPTGMLSGRKLIVTNRRVIFREGIIGRTEIVMPLERVQNIRIQYSIKRKSFRLWNN